MWLGVYEISSAVRYGKPKFETNEQIKERKKHKKDIKKEGVGEKKKLRLLTWMLLD